MHVIKSIMFTLYSAFRKWLKCDCLDISAILERKIIAYFYFNKKDQNVGWVVKRLTTRDVS